MPQPQTLEQTINKTDLGQIVYEYRKVILGVVVAFLVGSVSFSLYSQMKKTQEQEKSVKVFEFQKSSWEDFKTGKADLETFMKNLKSLDSSLFESPSFIPLALEISKLLVEKGSVEDSLFILNKVDSSNIHPYAQFFIKSQKASLLEKAGKYSEAVSTLEPLLKIKDFFMASKIYLEVGRLYLSMGEKSQAKIQFDYILSNYPNDEASKLAKLYLLEIGK